MQNLFRKYLTNQCTPEEVKQLLAHFDTAENESALRSLISESLATDQAFSEEETGGFNSVAAEVFTGIKKQIGVEKLQTIPFFKRTWFRIAASVVVVFSALVLFFLRKHEPVKIAEVKSPVKFENDIEPGGDKAVLILADGTRIVLDTTKNGTIALQGTSNVVKTADGQLSYTQSNTNVSEVLYNTVSTPRGGQYRLVLPDGSKVWLNAASSIYFPSAFVGSNRKVSVTGEVYFEVAKDRKMPFVVDMKGMQVEVLGTHFNINAYDDEPVIKTTLLEGALKVNKGSNSKFLFPGQQAQLNNTGDINIIPGADLEEIMAWKNGKFIFNSIDIRSVMRQLEKWYDIEVAYTGNLTKEEFIGVVSRNVNISQILNMLEKTRTVSFEIKGRKVFVK
ncbi:MAG: FecR domain-containing protein [Bacteroidota bacterium]